MEAAQKEKLLDIFGNRLSQAARMYLDNCARCGLCVEACHVYASDGELKHTAVARAQNVRKIYDRYFKKGWLGRKLDESAELDETWLKRIYETAFTCTGCRRCMTVCPMGIDTGVIQAIAKHLLIEAGEEPKVLSMLADMSVAKGKNIDNTKESFFQAVKNLEPDVVKLWPGFNGHGVVPVEVTEANVLYVALAGRHSIIPAAAIMNAAKESWSLSVFEAVNFGAFLGSPEKTKEIANRVVEEAKRLKVKEVAIVECGTAFRVMRHMIGEQPFKVITFVELIARYLKEGRINVRKDTIDGAVTYHDPCQIARQGGVYEEPRYVLSQLTDNFVEMTPNRQANWCCGGGGGLVAMGEKDFRMKSAKVKADQVRNSGAKVLATACENCHTQLSDLNDHYKVGVKVDYISDLVAHALIPTTVH